MKAVNETLLCFLSTFFAWISLHNAQALAAIAASCVGVISGIMATVHWWYSILEKRKNLKKQ